jgi:hypothetical protein
VADLFELLELVDRISGNANDLSPGFPIFSYILLIVFGLASATICEGLGICSKRTFTMWKQTRASIHIIFMNAIQRMWGRYNLAPIPHLNEYAHTEIAAEARQRNTKREGKSTDRSKRWSISPSGSSTTHFCQSPRAGQRLAREGPQEAEPSRE